MLWLGAGVPEESGGARFVVDEVGSFELGEGGLVVFVGCDGELEGEGVQHAGGFADGFVAFRQIDDGEGPVGFGGACAEEVFQAAYFFEEKVALFVVCFLSVLGVVFCERADGFQDRVDTVGGGGGDLGVRVAVDDAADSVVGGCVVE